jgi:hypothetical protein
MPSRPAATASAATTAGSATATWTASGPPSATSDFAICSRNASRKPVAAAVSGQTCGTAVQRASRCGDDWVKPSRVTRATPWSTTRSASPFGCRSSTRASTAVVRSCAGSGSPLESRWAATITHPERAARMADSDGARPTRNGLTAPGSNTPRRRGNTGSGDDSSGGTVNDGRESAMARPPWSDG